MKLIDEADWKVLQMQLMTNKLPNEMQGTVTIDKSTLNDIPFGKNYCLVLRMPNSKQSANADIRKIVFGLCNIKLCNICTKEQWVLFSLIEALLTDIDKNNYF